MSGPAHLAPVPAGGGELHFLVLVTMFSGPVGTDHSDQFDHSPSTAVNGSQKLFKFNKTMMKYWEFEH